MLAIQMEPVSLQPTVAEAPNTLSLASVHSAAWTHMLRHFVSGLLLQLRLTNPDANSLLHQLGKEKKRNEKKRKEQNRIDYAFRHQFNEKPGIILGCPGASIMQVPIDCTSLTEIQKTAYQPDEQPVSPFN